MQDGEKLSLEQIRVFLGASEEIQFEGKGVSRCMNGSAGCCVSRATGGKAR